MKKSLLTKIVLIILGYIFWSCVFAPVLSLQGAFIAPFLVIVAPPYGILFGLIEIILIIILVIFDRSDYIKSLHQKYPSLFYAYYFLIPLLFFLLFFILAYIDGIWTRIAYPHGI
jgi:hypothetical protein